MSYLDPPRIHFSGRFFADPSTVNNDPVHYDPDCTRPSPWQEPNGLHRFSFRHCQVTSVVSENGPADQDPLIGCPINSVEGQTTAKIVDIDVYQQGVSTIYGLQLQITLPDKGSLTGILDPAVLNDVWFNAVLPTRSWEPSDYEQDSFGGDMNACGFFQSVLRIDAGQWTDSSSAILNTLKSITLLENGQYLVSVKFVVDGYENVPQNAQFRTGRITGTLGPVFPNEPLYNPGQRWLMPRAFSQDDPWYAPSFYNAPFKVDAQRKKLVLDLANSICRASAGGDPVFLDQVMASVHTPDPVVMPIGVVDCSGFAYANNAMISELPLTGAQLAALEKGTLSLATSLGNIGDPAILTEPPLLPQVAVEVRPLRVTGDPGSVVTTTVYVSQAGKPLAGKQLAVFVESVHGDTPGATVPPTNKGNTPQADGALKAGIGPSDENGFATVTLTVVKDPGQRTPELDGQLYFVIVYDPDQPHPDWSKVAPAQNQMITCLAWSQYAVNENPSWEEVQSLLEPYAKLYPGMTALINLTDQGTFFIFSKNPPWSIVYHDNQPGPLGINAGAIPYYMSRDFNDPMFMPVSRDLSPGKVMTVMHYIKNLPMPDSPVDIPPYPKRYNPSNT